MVDESKFLKDVEVARLRALTTRERDAGIASGAFNKVRNWCMVELGLQAGLRVDEMRTLTHDKLYLDNGRSSLWVLGKGNKPRNVWIGRGLRAAIQQYASAKAQLGLPQTPRDHVLTRCDGLPITKRALQKAFRRLIHTAQLPSRYHIHSLRHTYATQLLCVTGNNYRFLQVQLGHASIKTTQIYAGIVEAEARQALDQLFPALPSDNHNTRSHPLTGGLS